MKKLYTMMAVAAVAAGANAQKLPTPVMSYDFEGVASVADLKAEQVGAGELRQSTLANFGTYYQNNPEGVIASHKNYLILPTQGFIKSQAKNKEAFSIAFWFNAAVANDTQGVDAAGHYYSAIIAAYSQSNSYKTFSWPMFSARTRGTLQINCSGWSDYVNEENVNGTNIESNEWCWTKMTEGTDEEGNPTEVATEFDENWHYVVLTFNGLNAKYYVDGQVLNEWNATNNNYSFPTVMNNLDALYLGDCGPFWQDKDGAYAYDDISFYASEIQPDQMELIMNIKYGNIGDEERLAIAQSQLQNVIEEAGETVGAYYEVLPSFCDEFLDYLALIDPSELTTIDDINAKIAEINAKVAEANHMTSAYDAVAKNIDRYSILANEMAYPGMDAFNEAIGTAKAAITDVKSLDAITAAAADLEVAKSAFLFSQAIPETGEGINVTKMILNPWFCTPEAEPVVTDEAITYTVENPGSYLTTQGWELSCTLQADKDITTYYTNGRTTANLFHSSTVAGGVLDVNQTVINLKPGYYSVSADMSSSSAPTDNHLYALADGVTKESAVPASLSFDGDAIKNWTPLITDKVRVGEDGTLTIGATSTTDGTQYKGWFCVTNFQLKYYGSDLDLSADLAAKVEEVNAAAAGLILKGDIAHAQADINAVLASDATDYDKISQLTDIIKIIGTCKEVEDKIVAIFDHIKAQAESVESPMAREFYQSTYNRCWNEIAMADNADVELLEVMQYVQSISDTYCEKLAAVESWGVETIIAEARRQIDVAKVAEEIDLNEFTQILTDMMKASVADFAASEAEPKDITGLVINPSFTGDSDQGWDITGTHANWYSECEFFNTNFHISQTIDGLPAGSYRIAVQGYYRDGGRDEAVAHWATIDAEGNNAYIANAHLYINSRSIAMLSMAADSVVGEAPATHPDGSAYAWYQPNPDAEAEALVSYPDGMNAAQYCFDNGMYAGNAVDIVLAEGEPLTFGIFKDETITYDWTIFDNFRLYYLGKDVPSSIDAPAPATAVTAAPTTIYSVSGSRLASMQRGINIVKMSDGTYRKMMK